MGYSNIFLFYAMQNSIKNIDDIRIRINALKVRMRMSKFMRMFRNSPDMYLCMRISRNSRINTCRDPIKSQQSTIIFGRKKFKISRSIIMEKLNYDCLMLIFKLLEPKDHISVAKTCYRWRHIIFDLWRRTYKELSLNFDIESWSIEDFAFLIEGISTSIEKIRLRSLTAEKFKILKLFEFPNVQRFSFTQWPRNLINDNDVMDMAKIFPNLRTFSPHGNFCGMNIDYFRNLHSLNLTYCSKLKFSHFEMILVKLNLKSIELNVFEKAYQWTSNEAFEKFTQLNSIFLNTNELKWLVVDISKFKTLKELTIADRDTLEGGTLEEFLFKLNKFKSNDIFEMETSINLPIFGPKINKYENLKKLILFSIAIKKKSFDDVCVFAPNLRQLVLKCCHISNAEDLIHLLERSNQIDSISVEQCKCSFSDLTIDAGDITQNRRKKVLILNFQGNCYEDESYPVFMPQFAPVSLCIKGSSVFLKTTSVYSTSVTCQPLQLIFK